MRSFYVLSFLFVMFAVNVESDESAELYTPENDNFDIDAAVANVDVLKGLVSCFLDTTDCDAVAADFKKDIREATHTGCIKCTKAQKVLYRKFLAGLKAKLPKEYEAFRKKYDEEEKHFADLEAAIANA